MLIKLKKEEIVKDLTHTIKESESLVFVNFHGLKVEDERVLRRGLQAEGVDYKVSRKTLLARALSGVAEGEVPELAGEVSIAYSKGGKGGSKDETVAPREIYNFQKTHKDILSILGGIFEGKFVGADVMNELARIPSRSTLYGQLANLLNSPMQRFAVALNEVAKSR
jgi:large subunit ribosomal protein L10